MAISGNLSTFFSELGNPAYHYRPQFHRGQSSQPLRPRFNTFDDFIELFLLSTVTVAAVVIFLYAWLVPIGVWGFLTWRQGAERQVGGYSFLETVCVYGYSLFIYIPTSVSTTSALNYLNMTKSFKKCLNTSSVHSSIPSVSPVQILWIIPFEWLRWTLIVIAMVISGSILVLTFWPVVRDDTKLMSVATVGTIVVLHALLAVGCKVSSL